MKQETKYIVIGIALFVGYRKVIKPVFDFFGLTKSDTDESISVQVSSPQSAFSPNYWRNYFYSAGTTANGRRPLTNTMINQAKQYAKRIYDAMGYLSDDEDEVVGAFTSMGSKSIVSLTCYFFSETYQGKNLLMYLKNGVDILPQNGLSDSIIEDIINTVRNKPPY